MSQQNTEHQDSQISQEQISQISVGHDIEKNVGLIKVECGDMILVVYMNEDIATTLAKHIINVANRIKYYNQESDRVINPN